MDRDRFFGTVQKSSLFEPTCMAEDIPVDCHAVVNANRLPTPFGLEPAVTSHGKSIKELYEIVHSC